MATGDPLGTVATVGGVPTGLPVGAPVALADGIAVGGDSPGTGAYVGSITGVAIGLEVEMAVGVVQGDREGAAFGVSVLPEAVGCEVGVVAFGPAVGMACIGPHPVGLFVGAEDEAGGKLGTEAGAAVTLAVGDAVVAGTPVAIGLNVGDDEPRRAKGAPTGAATGEATGLPEDIAVGVAT